jgi:hypothetical protein
MTKKQAKTTALARRRRLALVRGNRRKQPDTNAIVTASPDPRSMTLGDDPYIGALGLVEVKLTTEEEIVLQRPVQFNDVLVKPTGQPYLSHPTYTKWLNDAFGRTGWGLTPASKAIAGQPDDRGRVTIVQSYVLYIHGKPVAFAMGEHEYHATNAEQTYGDALEATNASALRRCCKRLGIGLELWDKTFLNRFLQERCVRVWVDDEKKPRTRRMTDPPFYKERGLADPLLAPTTGQAVPVRREEPPPHDPAPAYHKNLDETITTGQKSQHHRLWAIAGRAQRKEDEVHAWLQQRYGLASTKAIPRRLYDEICNWLEQPGPLPPKVIR